MARRAKAQAQAQAQQKNQTDWVLIPSSTQDIERVRQNCRRLVTRRAAISAGVSALPIPGVVAVSDASLFALMIDDINREFGLTPEQILLLRPELKMMAYEAMAGMGGMMMGKLAARTLLTRWLDAGSGGLIKRQAAKLVPIASQIAASALAFTIFKMIGNQHVDACALAAQASLVPPGN